MSSESEPQPIYLGKKEVGKYLEGKWQPLIEVIQDALCSFSNGEVIQPVRSSVPIDKHDGLLLTMPAYSGKDDALATKLVTIFAKNNEAGLPTIGAVVLYYDSSNGVLKAIMDGQMITEMRTAAASAVATKYLAKKDPKVLAILGAGAQARSHYKVLTHMYKSISKVCVWNYREESARKFVAEIKPEHSPEYHETVEGAVKDADIIVTATMSQTPVLYLTWVKAGAHINAVGAPSPTWQELSSDLMRSSVVYVDSKEAALVESGDIIKTGASIFAEIGEVISGKEEALSNKITVFKSLGMAIEDVVTAKLVYDSHVKAKCV